MGQYCKEYRSQGPCFGKKKEPTKGSLTLKQQLENESHQLPEEVAEDES
jgi:hypothetical protein